MFSVHYKTYGQTNLKFFPKNSIISDSYSSNNMDYNEFHIRFCLSFPVNEQQDLQDFLVAYNTFSQSKLTPDIFYNLQVY